MAVNVGLGGFYTIVQAGNGALSAPGISDASAASYLSRETGLLAEKTRNVAAITMLNGDTMDPNRIGSYAAYQVAVDAKTTAAGALFRTDFNQLMDLGLPEDRAKAIATAKASRSLADELEILKLKYPLAGDINSVASKVAGIPLQLGQKDKSEKYREFYKKSKKAKKEDK